MSKRIIALGVIAGLLIMVDLSNSSWAEVKEIIVEEESISSRPQPIIVNSPASKEAKYTEKTIKKLERIIKMQNGELGEIGIAKKKGIKSGTSFDAEHLPDVPDYIVKFIYYYLIETED